jgi:ABC-type antimicrobial peptide transport system permease subunit
MLFHYLKTSFRNFKRNRTHTLINVLGLSLGMLAAMILFVKIRYEMRFDQYHADKEQIYRVVAKSTQYGDERYGESMPDRIAEGIRMEIPELEAVTVLFTNFQRPVIKIGEGDESQKFFGDHVAYADPEVFEILHYDWLHGNAEQALANPYAAVISRSLAEKYFGKVDVVGERFRFSNDYDFTISGVVEDPPHHTSFYFKMLLSNLTDADKRLKETWNSTSSSVQCLVKLLPNQTPEALVEPFKGLIIKKFEVDEPERADLTYFLQPLDEVHYDTRFGVFNSSPTSKKTYYTLALIGLFLLVTACINFVNLNTVLVFTRAKEVGVRKVLGGSRNQIVKHYLSETGLIALIALWLAFAVLPWASLQLEELLGGDLSISITSDWQLWGFSLGIFIIVILLSGLYPAFLLSKLHPTLALKNKTQAGYGKKTAMRKSLVVLQFTISQVLIVCTLIMIKQMNYFHSVPLGLDKEAVVEFNLAEDDPKVLETMKNEIMLHAGIKNVTFSNTGSSSSNTWSGNFNYRPEGKNEVATNTHVKFIDEDYLDTYGMTLLAGENVRDGDSSARYLINETLMEVMGFEDPVTVLGEPISFWGRDGVVVGVIQDFHMSSLHNPIKPLVLSNEEPIYTRAAVKLKGGTLEDNLAHIQKSWETAFPEAIFEHKFLDESIDEFYRREKRSAQLFQLFAGIAIFIGCLGLFGLISFLIARRTKEIGIRKVLGATVGEIMQLFIRDFVILVIIGFAISVFLSWFFMDKWLEDFAYKINIGWEEFFYALVASVVLVLITIGYRAYRAARTNPIDALRDE